MAMHPAAISADKQSCPKLVDYKRYQDPRRNRSGSAQLPQAEGKASCRFARFKPAPTKALKPLWTQRKHGAGTAGLGATPFLVVPAFWTNVKDLTFARNCLSMPT